MNKFSVIIPSRNAANLMPCVRAIREAGETCRIIVVDDGVNWKSFIEMYPASFTDDIFSARSEGVNPFQFSRNINIGIRAAGDDDVILLNDDALLKTQRGFTAMQREAADWGMIGAACNNVGNPNQNWRRHSPICEDHLMRHEMRMLCFVCVYIPRSTINAVGLLDERFVDYGLDDDDYSLRVLKAGLKLGVLDGCFVDHGSLTSTFRGPYEDRPMIGDKKASGDFSANMRRFIEKWGTDNWGNDRAHSPFAKLFPTPEPPL